MYSRVTVLVLMIVSMVAAGPAFGDVWRFDFGTKDSPVMEGYSQVTGETAYSAARKCGWETGGQKSFTTKTPGETPMYQYGGMISRPMFYNDHVNSMRRDGVASSQEMVFRADVPNGEYRVRVILGNMVKPLESMWVDCNGVNVAKDIASAHRLAWHRGDGFGFFYSVRFNAKVTDSVIRLKFYGNDDQFHKNMAIIKKHFEPKIDNRGNTYYRHPRKVFQRKFDPDDQQVFYPGKPFKENSVLAVEILPAMTPPFFWEGAQLRKSSVAMAKADAFVSAFNSGDFKKAGEALESAGNSHAIDAASGYLHLIGHPETHEKMEPAWIKRAEALLKRVPASTVSEEYLRDLDLFKEARLRFTERSLFHAKTGEGYKAQLAKVSELTRRIGEDSPLHYKAQQYRGRACAMHDPNRWGHRTGDCRLVFWKLMETWPKDKFGLFYTQNKWEPDEDWHFGDHAKNTEGVPDWAKALKVAYGRTLDMTEWWRNNKQRADGSIGGGWGDDVEIVGFFGLYGFISEGASPGTMSLTEDLIDGMWNNSELDTEAGFCRPVADAEHSAEWSGDTLGLMVQLQYGNPIWIERALKTAKLMKNLWMAPNDQGNLHFKANYFGALRTGGGPQSNDSYINYRATRPAVMVHWYNENPAVGKIFTKWADGWVDAAMSTARGKPEGVIPAEVSWPEGIIGGINSPNWYTSVRAPHTVNYHFQPQKYKGYMTNLLTMAYDITGDMKYLEPLRKEAEIAQAYAKDPVDSPKEGSREWAGSILSGGAAGRAGDSATGRWKTIEKRITGKAGAPKITYEPDYVAKRVQWVADYMEERWPNLTTETAATDRVAFPGIIDPYMIMSGATGDSIMQMYATYAGMGKDAVAFVQAADERYLQVLAYNFTEKPLDASIIPWMLEVGGTYEVVYGADTNGDQTIDKGKKVEKFTLDRRGKRCAVTLAPRRTMVIKLKQTKAGRGGGFFPDLAIVEEEISYSPRWEELEVVLHNIGAKSVENILVTASAVSPSGKAVKIGSTQVSYMPWSRDLEPSRMRVGIAYKPKSEVVRIRIEVDPNGKIDEITPINNTAEKELTFDLSKLGRPKKPASSGGRRGR
ncbi:hypothetical protein ACFL1X_02565 [Candidatus Hydrogenedentota bacterium]